MPTTSSPARPTRTSAPLSKRWSMRISSTSRRSRVVGEKRTGWRLLCAAWVLVCFFRVGLGLFGFRRLKRFFPARDHEAPRAYARRVAAAVQSASRLVPGTTCLAQACAAWALLNARGYNAILRIGLRKVGDRQVIGHAW